MKNVKAIKNAFKKTNLTLDFGDDYLNIMRPDGLHCEFYSDGNFNYLTSTYTLNGKVQDLTYYIPDLPQFVADVKEILK